MTGVQTCAFRSTGHILIELYLLFRTKCRLFKCDRHRFSIKIGADFIALSFVRNADDINDVHQIMDEAGVRIPVIAKIEKPQAVDNLFDIVSAFDGIMVARGDLGVEMPLESVPLAQKRAIELARRQAKPVIVA